MSPPAGRPASLAPLAAAQRHAAVPEPDVGGAGAAEARSRDLVEILPEELLG